MSEEDNKYIKHVVFWSILGFLFATPCTILNIWTFQNIDIVWALCIVVIQLFVAFVVYHTNTTSEGEIVRLPSGKVVQMPADPHGFREADRRRTEAMEEFLRTVEDEDEY